MRNLFLILIIALFFFSCGKKQEQLSPDDLKKKELEQKEKQLDSLENEMKKDSIKKVSSYNKVKGESFTFMNKDLIFLSSFEEFLGTFTEFKENNELKTGNEKVASYTSRPKGCEINYNVYFGSSGLEKFEMKSNCSSGQDEKIIKIITSQFKFIPSKNKDEEEMGDVVETYKKGKLTATAFIGGFYILTIKQIK
jgi:hypothetical protein